MAPPRPSRAAIPRAPSGYPTPPARGEPGWSHHSCARRGRVHPRTASTCRFGSAVGVPSASNTSRACEVLAKRIVGRETGEGVPGRFVSQRDQAQRLMPAAEPIPPAGLPAHGFTRISHSPGNRIAGLRTFVDACGVISAIMRVDRRGRGTAHSPINLPPRTHFNSSRSSSAESRFRRASRACSLASVSARVPSRLSIASMMPR